MKQNLIIVFFLCLIFCCKSQEDPLQFSTEALEDVLIDKLNEKVTFQDILNKHKGKTIVIDVWASWCGDCLKSLPKVKALQAEHPNVEFVFLSLDKTTESWKKGIKKHNIKGQHYFLSSGWKGKLGSFLNLDWIPRYLVVDKNQRIKVFYSKNIQTPKIKNALL
ncbi:TlpA disulfide reductase family protein [Aurantibacter aestuarii]|uniref:Redoxin n=1 Tax=Aurantibacter aestuarii TaxID=1266046 RepID=A0A2T1N514_9FLAO|nr:TlpA disulfide reductase family protein [Aurantibacter aestuarii]PSG86378.1 redoxin [Aurantibacter aestuarii]